MTSSTPIPQTSPVTAVPLSIVIPAFNEQDLIRRSLQASVDQTVPALEIIVVDNASTDATSTVVEEFRAQHPAQDIRLLSQRALKGLVPTRNLGFDAARGTVIGRFDADSIPSPNWVEQAQACFTDPEVSAVTGPVYYWDLPFRALLLRTDRLVRRLMLAAVPKYRFLFGSNMALRKSAWELVRGEVCADADDQMHEDIDLALHLTAHGQRIAYNNALITGISARKLHDSPKDFLAYITRFDRTYAAHGIRSRRLRIPTFFFLAVYFPAKFLRAAYLLFRRTHITRA